MLGTKGLGDKIIWVRFSRKMCHTKHTFTHSSPNPMIVNFIVLLRGGAIGNGADSNHAIIIYHTLVCTINSNSNNTELVKNQHGQLCGNSCGR